MDEPKITPEQLRSMADLARDFTVGNHDFEAALLRAADEIEFLNRALGATGFVACAAHTLMAYRGHKDGDLEALCLELCRRGVAPAQSVRDAIALAVKAVSLEMPS